MNPPDEFQKRAADCMHMARLSRDPESNALSRTLYIQGQPTRHEPRATA
jgi:hypothetical protein